MAEIPSTPPPRQRRPRRQRPPRDLNNDPARPGFGVALLVILLATGPLLGIMYLGAQRLRLPFTPFDRYD